MLTWADMEAVPTLTSRTMRRTCLSAFSRTGWKSRTPVAHLYAGSGAAPVSRLWKTPQRVSASLPPDGLVLHVGNCGLWLAGHFLCAAKRCFQYPGRRWA